MKMLLVALLLLPTLAQAQTMTYEERAALAKSESWQNRVGMAAQQQAILAQGENPSLCCQTSAQEALSPGDATICDLTIPPGTAGAADYVKAASVERHNARARLAADVFQNPILWSQRMGAIIASDQCVTSTFTDAQLQAYMVRAWDLWALTPELSATPVAPPPERVLPGMIPPRPSPPKP